MAASVNKEDLVKISESIYEIPKKYRSDMRVPARIFVSEHMLDDVFGDRSVWQLMNVATLPGVQKYVCAMPDIHEGYGFPIGGVAAMAIDEGGVISPGGIGYDINCGVRLLRSNISRQDIKKDIEHLATELFNVVPSGVGRGGSFVVSMQELDVILQHGAQHMLKAGYGDPRDIALCEEEGAMQGALPDLVSMQAKKRGLDQLGTLGSGNHFLEVQAIDEIYDENVAQIFGLRKNDVTVMIHCGSRGLGHQVCTDYVRAMLPQLQKWPLQLPDKELVCAPFSSTIAKEYFAAMQAAANFAWANRHMISHAVRHVWRRTFGHEVQLDLVYDLSHNIGKVETHVVNGVSKQLIIHRKGATRAFGPQRPEIPADYQHVGQPVLIPGTMGTSSYVMVGTNKGMDVAFGTCCHGAGRKMSRVQAKKEVRGSQLRELLRHKGIVIRSDSDVGLAEEAPEAYKDVDLVVDVVEKSHLAKKVARLVPIAVIKGG